MTVWHLKHDNTKKCVSATRKSWHKSHETNGQNRTMERFRFCIIYSTQNKTIIFLATFTKTQTQNMICPTTVWGRAALFLFMRDLKMSAPWRYRVIKRALELLTQLLGAFQVKLISKNCLSVVLVGMPCDLSWVTVNILTFGRTKQQVYFSKPFKIF